MAGFTTMCGCTGLVFIRRRPGWVGEVRFLGANGLIPSIIKKATSRNGRNVISKTIADHV
jgi:hypothetical protein